MIWLKIISKFIKAFRSGSTPGRIAAGFALGFLLGVTPFRSLQGVILLTLLVLLDVNLAAGTVAMLLASLISIPLDRLFHAVGFSVLTLPVLQGFWTFLYNTPVAPLSRFYNTVVMGGFLTGLVLFLPLFFGMKRLVTAYRSGLDRRVQQWKIVQVLKSSRLVRFYLNIRDLGGA
ncbi:TIGR03546 family protein [bacterium]|nr:TIGR03546 family protein [bacterium]